MTSDCNKSVTCINSSEQLDRHCQAWQRQTVLAIDTEFVRTNTFYPKAGLIQLADENGICLIDPIMIEDLTPLAETLSNPAITWVVHSGSEDLILLLTQFGSLPRHVFDTQIAAAYLGFGFSLSYQALVNEVLHYHVEKGETRSNWLRRPLSDRDRMGLQW